jgi:hypothetical protein
MILIYWLFGTLLMSEALSLFNRFTMQNLRYGSVIFFLALFLCQVTRKDFQKKIYEKKVLFSYIIISLPSLFAGLFISPNNWDSMTYHFPRFLHWFQNGNLDYFYTSISRQNVSPILPDLLFGQFFAIFLSDRFLFLPVWLSVFFSSIYIHKITYLITGQKKTSFIAGILSLTLPSQVAFMSSTQTDPLSTLLIVLLLYFTILVNRNKSISFIYVIILMIPILITSKTTALILSFPIFIYVFAKNWQKVTENLAKLATFLFLILIPALPYLLRTWSLRRDNLGVFNSDFSPLGLAINSARYILSNLQTPFLFINNILESAFYRSGEILSFNPNPDGYGNYGDFQLTTSLHGDLSGNPVHTLILITAVFTLIIAKKNLLLVCLLATQTLLLATFIGWQPWINRFSSTILVLGTILIAIWMRGIQKYLSNALLALLLAYSSFWVFFNPSRAIVNPTSLVEVAKKVGMESDDLNKIRYDLELSKEQQYFSLQPELEKPYISMARYLQKSKVDKLLIKVGGDDFEYPIWALTDFKIEIRHFDMDETSSLYSTNNYILCTTYCKGDNFRLLLKNKNISLWKIQ